jgi:hypothetical protein
MSKARFKRKHSVLKPEWILGEAQGGTHSAQATASLSIAEQQITKANNRTQNTNNSSINSLPSIREAQPALPVAQSAKSRYSKTHSPAWIMDSTQEEMKTRSANTSRSKLHSSAQKSEANTAFIDSPSKNRPILSMDPPPAPTRARFRAEDVPRHLGRRHSASSHSQSSGADAPARMPHNTSYYTPTVSPDMLNESKPQS